MALLLRNILDSTDPPPGWTEYGAGGATIVACNPAEFPLYRGRYAMQAVMDGEGSGNGYRRDFEAVDAGLEGQTLCYRAKIAGVWNGVGYPEPITLGDSVGGQGNYRWYLEEGTNHIKVTGSFGTLDTGIVVEPNIPFIKDVLLDILFSANGYVKFRWGNERFQYGPFNTLTEDVSVDRIFFGEFGSDAGANTWRMADIAIGHRLQDLPKLDGSNPNSQPVRSVPLTFPRYEEPPLTRTRT